MDDNNFIDINYLKLRSPMDELRSQIGKLNDRISELNSQIGERDKQINTLERRFARMDTLYEITARENRMLKQQLEELKRKPEKPNKRNTKDIDDEKIIELIKQGYSYRKVADMTGYAKSTVNFRHKKHLKEAEKNVEKPDEFGKLKSEDDLPF